MEDIRNLILKKENWREKVLEVFYTQSGYEDWNSSTLSETNQELGFLWLIEKDIKKAKQYFSNTGYIDIYLVKNYSKSHSRFFDYNIQRCLAPILSDNCRLITEYSKLRYKTFFREDNSDQMKPLSMDEMVAIGESPIWCNTVQFFMANDNGGVEKNLDLIETKTKKIAKRKVWDLMNDDYEFYKALHTGDKARMEEVLAKLVSPKVHKKRNDDPILNQYISLPALGYAKLAWRKGIEVEVNSPLVPKELLPIQPLEKYEVPYDFLNK